KVASPRPGAVGPERSGTPAPGSPVHLSEGRYADARSRPGRREISGRPESGGVLAVDSWTTALRRRSAWPDGQGVRGRRPGGGVHSTGTSTLGRRRSERGGRARRTGRDDPVGKRDPAEAGRVAQPQHAEK